MTLLYAEQPLRRDGTHLAEAVPGDKTVVNAQTEGDKSDTDLDFECHHVAQVVFYTDVVGHAIVADAEVAQLVAVVLAEPEPVDLNRLSDSHLNEVVEVKDLARLPRGE